MNESDKRELEQLKQQHQLIAQQLASLAGHIQRLETQITSAAAPAEQEQPAPTPTPVTIASPPIAAPPIIQPPSRKSRLEEALACPPPTPTSEFVPEFLQRDQAKADAPTKAEIVVPSPPPILPSANELKPSFEMQLGTYWLVRIGAVLILTGLVFFGNLAYQKMGAGGKVALLYLASGLLLGAGAWWQRKAANKSLHNFAQVLFAGGLAAVYFTTYAAHHVPALQIIGSALLDGALLLGWAGYIAWIADRRKSELLALFATGLAYYTSIITPVGNFTLYSNLVLTLTAVFFLVRNRWAGLSWASLIATYAAYAWWRFYHGGEGWRWASPDEGLGFGASFLFSYWLVFTVAAFLSKHENIAGNHRAAFITFNNGALFSLFVLTMLQVNTGRFWQFALGYGSVLLALAELSRRFLSAEPITKNTYLTQGLVLVTVGLVSKFAGTQLALILAAESVILFILGTLRKNIFLQTGAYISGAMSVGWGIDSLQRDNFSRLILGTALGSLMALNACWSAWRRLWADRRVIRPEPAYFTLLALLMWLATTWFNTTTALFPLALGVEALVLTATIYFLRVREIALMSQGLMVIAHIGWLTKFIDPLMPPPWWNPLLLISLTLGLSHWWQKQRSIALRPAVSAVFQSIYAIAIITILHNWLEPRFTSEIWIAATSLLALTVTGYAIKTRLWPLAISAQIFLLVSGWQFATQLAISKPSWHFPLAPIAALVMLSFATWNWFARHPETQTPLRHNLLKLALLYRWIALVMLIAWVNKYIAATERPWVFTLMGTTAFAIAGWRRYREAILFSAALTVTGFAALWLLPERAAIVYLPNFLVVLILLAQQQIARHKTERYELSSSIHTAMIIAGCGTLWWLVSHWVLLSASGFYLTASWSALAFACIGGGVLLREKIYRWVGLGILGTALGRIVLFDVWKLETFYRVLSFMALGVVLVVLGFIYNKYQAKIREWL
ncbi:MAG: DUF2339 domain-containing protein [Verrucomicrobiota bacterium]